MNSAPMWLQDFLLNLNGNEIFWAPIVMIGVGLLFLWVLPSIKGSAFTVLGWVMFALMGGGAAFIWSSVWDWRAAEYSAELEEEVSGVELMGTVVDASDIRSDQYGVASIRLDLDYEFGFSEVYAVSDVEDLIDFMVINYKLEDESGSDQSYLHTMRDFQQIRVEIGAGDAEPAGDDVDMSVNDILSYERSTLLNYANSVSLRDPDSGFFWSDTEISSEEEVSGAIGDTGYRVVRNDLSPWDMRDERASDGGVSEGQWVILHQAPEAMNAVNNAACGVFNGFNECEEGQAREYHPVLLAFIMLLSVIIGAVVIESLIRRGADRRHKRQMAETAKTIENKLSGPPRPRSSPGKSGESSRKPVNKR